ncbi:MAG TPA: protein-methionine-sulfoxide reductase heme-binding subunit MsrQ [Vicinamibacterales bacterium]
MIAGATGPAIAPAATDSMVARLKPLVFLAALVPFGALVYGAFADTLGANPLDAITDETGTWTLRFLVLTLLITPLRRWTGWNWLIRYRRMLGLFAFFYGSLHFLTYIWFDQFFDLAEITADIGRRPFITVGFSAFVLMVPLAATSTAGWIRRLGGRRWNRLHRLVYASATLAVVHYLWLVKADTSRPVRYGVIIGILLAARLWFAYNARHANTSRAAAARRGGLPDRVESADAG